MSKVTKKSPEKVESQRKSTTEMHKFFLKIWKKRLKFCQSCGSYLFFEPKSYNFDHLLEKGSARYKHLRFEEDNIAVVCLDCHSKKTNGFPTKIHQELINNAKIKFNII